MTNNIQESRKKRFQFLHKLYETTGGSQLEIVNLFELGDELGLSQKETNLIGDYLNGEGLIEYVTMGGGISITHFGIVQVEEALANPEQPTEYFPPVNIIYVHQMTGSQIQQGTNQSTQTMTVSSADIESIARFIGEFKNQQSELELDEVTQMEAEADISTLEAQIKSSRPKHPIIRECLASLRSILENAAGQIVAIYLLGQFPKY